MSIIDHRSRTAGLAAPGMAALVLAAGLALGVAAGDASAQSGPGDRPGRYTMQPVEGGFLRLDTETGAVSLCTRQAGTFACEGVKDERDQLRAEVERLKTENGDLKAEVDRLQKGATGPDATPDGERRRGKLAIPSEKDVDEALDTMERLYKKFRDRIKRLEKEKDRGEPL